MSEPSIPSVVAGVRKTFDQGRTKPLAWRRAQLRGLRDLLVQAGPQLEQAVWSDLRKSASEAQLTEINITISEVDVALKHLASWTRPARTALPPSVLPARGWVVSEPLGTVLVIGTWNYPILLLLTPLIGALAAGNSAVLKPSELAPATADAIARLVPKYLDPDAVAVIRGDADTTDAILAERFDSIFFTGSGRVGRIVMTAAAKNLTPVVLELGGKSPVYVDDTVDLAEAARRIAWGRFSNAGQTCVAPDYVLATRPVQAELERHLVVALREMWGGDPASSDDYGRIVNDANFERLAKLLDNGRRVTGGETDPATRYIAPTVLADVPRDSAVMAAEIFGPVLPIVTVADVDDAIGYIRANDKPLSLYVYSSDREVRRRFITQTSSGAIGFDVNTIHLAVPELPFGGVGESGMGAYHGKRSFQAFSHEKALLSKTLAPDTLKFVYPPYSKRKYDLITKLFRRLG